MSILITGGCGYLGSHLCLELAEQKIPVVVVDNLFNSQSEVLKKIEDQYDVYIPFYNIDLNNFHALDSVFVNHQIKAVFHFAGLKSVGQSIKNPLHYYYNNISGTITLLQVMEKHQCYQLIFSSSATVYGIPDQIPVTEESPTKAINPYGHTKLMIEEILETLSQTHFWKIISLRYFNPVGCHPSGILQENPQGVPENLVPYLMKVAKGELDILTIFGRDYPTSDGTCVRDYIHVIDLIQGHIQALKYLQKEMLTENNYQVFNLGTGKGTSVLELVETCQKVGIPIKFQYGSRRSGDAPAIYANVDKAKKLLDWQAQLNLSDMLKDAYRAIKKNDHQLTPTARK